MEKQHGGPDQTSSEEELPMAPPGGGAPVVTIDISDKDDRGDLYNIILSTFFHKFTDRLIDREIVIQELITTAMQHGQPLTIRKRSDEIWVLSDGLRDFLNKEMESRYPSVYDRKQGNSNEKSAGHWK